MEDNNTVIQHHWSDESFKNFSDPNDFDTQDSYGNHQSNCWGCSFTKYLIYDN